MNSAPSQTAGAPAPKSTYPRVRFDRNELSGAFGDIGTDFPLIVGMILAAHLDPASVLIIFGVMQLMTGLLYGMPMPAQPLKAMAVIVITQNLAGNILYAGGLVIGLVMLLLTVTGLIDGLARAVPKTVVRGIQFGLGLQLSMLALKDYLPAEGREGYVLGAICFVLILALLGNRKVPPGLLAILLGAAFAIFFRVGAADIVKGIGVHLPQFHVPAAHDMWIGLLVLAIPQIPLSLGNSILATEQLARDFFPGRGVTVRKIGYTYSAMNLINPFFGGVPTCHGSGGIAGHYAFGARTGGSVILYGSIYLTLGLFFAGSFGHVVLLFPKPVLGVILLFEALALMGLSRDTVQPVSDFLLVILVGLMAVALPWGYVVALVVGTVLAYAGKGRLRGLTK